MIYWLPFAIWLLLVIYFATPFKLRGPLLLAVSVIYYLVVSNFTVFSTGLLLGSIGVDYALALRMPHATKPARLLRVSITINLGILAIFKFPTVFLPLFNGIAAHLATDFRLDTLTMPVGLSFYTFTKLGYVIDTFQQTTPPEKHLGRFVTFVAFFPNIVAGPIEKSRHLLPQFERAARFDNDRIVESLRRILWGVFKKLVIANRLAVYVDYVYGDPRQFDGRMLLLATLFFSIQIYADFSGYTDIVLGVARLFGFDLLENFNRPYFAVSVLDFWTRWHISLTAWIRGYLFMPISRRLLKTRWGRSPRVAQALAYIVVMGLVGLWHGSQLTFIVWGLLHAFYLVVLMLLPAQYRLPPKGLSRRLAQVLITFVLVTLAWIFFRATSLDDATYIITHLFDFDARHDLLAPFKQSFLLFEASIEMVLALLLAALVLVVDWLSLRQVTWQKIPVVLRWGTYYALLAGIIMTQLFNSIESQTFIYRQF